MISSYPPSTTLRPIYWSVVRNDLYKRAMSNLHLSLFAILVSASLPSLYRIIYRLMVSCSTPPTTHHRPPQNIFTLWRIWYPGSRLTIPRHFLQIPLISCLLWRRVFGICWSWHCLCLQDIVSSPNLSYKILKNGTALNILYYKLQH